MSRFSVEIFMSHSAEKFRKGILLFFRKFLVSESFMGEKRGCHVLPSKIFGLTVPKNFVGEDFGVSENLGYRKFLCIRERGGVSRFSVENFCHTVPKNFVGEQFGVSEIFVYRKFLCIRRGYH